MPVIFANLSGSRNSRNKGHAKKTGFTVTVKKSDKDKEADEVNQSVDSKDAVMMQFEVAGL